MVFSWNASEDNRLGTDKTTLHAYGETYERVFRDLNARRPAGAVLEIGVFSGASIVNLRQAFPERRLYGLDIDLGALVYPLTDDANTVYLQMDATDAAAVGFGVGSSIPHEETFALVIDDGSHRVEDIVAAFVLWGHRVAAGGYYVIEDITEDILPTLQHLLVPLGAKHGIQWELVDVRAVKNRWDDIMLVGRRAQDLNTLQIL